MPFLSSLLHVVRELALFVQLFTTKAENKNENFNQWCEYLFLGAKMVDTAVGRLPVRSCDTVHYSQTKLKQKKPEAGCL